ncbi:bacteriocin class II family protein, partial [Lactococcus lactis]
MQQQELNLKQFKALSDEELSEIVGGGYPNNQSMNDVLHW